MSLSLRLEVWVGGLQRYFQRPACSLIDKMSTNRGNFVPLLAEEWTDHNNSTQRNAEGAEENSRNPSEISTTCFKSMCVCPLETTE